MIFKQEDIAVFQKLNTVVVEGDEKYTYRLHKPTGVFFAYLTQLDLSSNVENNILSFDLIVKGTLHDTHYYSIERLNDVVRDDRGRLWQRKYVVDEGTEAEIGQIENSLYDEGITYFILLSENKNNRKEYAYYTLLESQSSESKSGNVMKFAFFKIAALNAKGEEVDVKTFDGKTPKSFFEAVRYFESLIEKRQPQPKQEDPSVGIFIFMKGLDSMVEAFGNKVKIKKDDVAKVFTPPKTKKYGRLNMYAVEDPSYDVIKAKFALKYDEQLTESLGAKNVIYKGVSLVANENLFVYKMTPYETSESGEESSEPQEVNQEQLSPNEIEGEDPQNMKGENQQEGEGQEGEGQEGEGQEGEGEGKEGKGKEGKGKGKGEEGEGEKGEGKEGKGEEGKGKGEEGEGEKGEGKEGKGESNQNKPNKSEEKLNEREGGDPTNIGGENEMSGEGNEQTQGQGQGQGTQSGLENLGKGEGEFRSTNAKPLSGQMENPDAVRNVVENELGGLDLISYFRKKGRIEKFLDNYPQEEIEAKFYSKLNVPKGTPKREFIKQIGQITDKFFE